MAFRRKVKIMNARRDPCSCPKHCPTCRQKCMGGHPEDYRHWCPTGCDWETA